MKMFCFLNTIKKNYFIFNFLNFFKISRMFMYKFKDIWKRNKKKKKKKKKEKRF